MKRPLAYFAASLVFGHSLVSGASAECASASDRAALRTAAMQQQMMVAALKCERINEYNRFVLSHQPELIGSDRALEAYFQRGDKARGTATYNKYKTELANGASLRSSQDPDGFCAAADRAFDIALQPMSLAEIVTNVDVAADRSIESCPVLADNNPTPTVSPPSLARASRAMPDMSDASRMNAAPTWDSNDENDDAGQSLDSRARSETDGPPPNWALDDDPDE